MKVTFLLSMTCLFPGSPHVKEQVLWSRLSQTCFLTLKIFRAFDSRPVERFPPPKITYSGYIYVGRRGARSLARSLGRSVGHICCLFCKFPISQNVRPPRSDDRKKRLETLDGDDTHTKMNPSCCILKQESRKLGTHNAPLSADEGCYQSYHQACNIKFRLRELISRFCCVLTSHVVPKASSSRT